MGVKADRVRRCGVCGGTLPGQPGRSCRCPGGWAEEQADAAVDWEQVMHLLVVRSGQRCEARTPDCLGVGRTRTVAHLARGMVSIHHRRPRRMGGTDKPDTHHLTNLMLLCGHGTVGCHRWVEVNRTTALARGYVLFDGQDPARERVVLPGGRAVLLEPWPAYRDVSDPPTFALDVPAWSDAA